MKRLLIISPYFPPTNAADMQRVRMSLPYFNEFGWNAEVVAVAPEYSDLLKDDLLLQSIPKNIKIHEIKAFNKKRTLKFGLGSLAIRSLWFYRKKVNQILKETDFDLIYFSTTQFPVCILGAYWKKYFHIPYVIDMQDPWHSTYYLDKPKDQRPPKYWFSYRLNKYLEPIAMKWVNGLISVSENYITDLKARYPAIKRIPTTTIPFGAFAADLKIAVDNQSLFKPILEAGKINIVYIGRGGADMGSAVSVLFKAVKKGIENEPGSFEKIKLYFIGTSYAPAGQGKVSILPIAQQFGIDDKVVEITDRISFYHTLATLQKADALFIPGSDDPKYSASKIYPYLLSKKPILAIFNSKSAALNILKTCGAEYAYSYDDTNEIDLKIIWFIKNVVGGEIAEQSYNDEYVQRYSAKNMTRLQCKIFDQITRRSKKNDA